MSYFCFVPEDAKDKEHLTIAWRPPDAPLTPPGWPSDWKNLALARANALCPFYGVVAAVEEWHSTIVQLIRVPHDVHVTRFVVFDSLSMSEHPWSPHITKCQERKLGDMVKFVRAEFRPDGY